MNVPTPYFRTLKHLVSIESLLMARGLLKDFRNSDQRLTGPCPIHHGHNPSAFVVLRAQNRWRCFSACQASGDVIDLAARLERVSLGEAAQRLLTLAGCDPQSASGLSPPARPARGFVPYRGRIPLEEHAPFLQAKGISALTARAFDVGLYPGAGWLRDCIAVRLFDAKGHPLGYAGRRLLNTSPAPSGKWQFPPGLPANTLLYNFHRIAGAWEKGCAIVECPWGVMRLHQLQISAVALMGTQLSDAQVLLLRTFPRVVLMMDGDPAGCSAQQRSALRLASTTDVVQFHLGAGLDPDDLPDAELARIRVLLEA